MAIDAKELRIGNYIDCSMGYVKVYEITENSFRAASESDFPGTKEKYELIPLTTEILEKCGFRIKKGTISNSSAIYSDFGTGSYRIYLSGGEISLHYNVDDIWFPEIRKIEYLHTFQNWYYFNIEKELEIKL